MLIGDWLSLSWLLLPPTLLLSTTFFPTAADILWKVAPWIIIWTLCHFLVTSLYQFLLVILERIFPVCFQQTEAVEGLYYQLIQKVHAESVNSCNHMHRLFNLRRLFRLQLYACGALFVVISQFNSVYDRLLHQSSGSDSEYEAMLCAAAAGHWIVSFFECIAAREEIISHLQRLPSETMEQLINYHIGGYQLLQHAVHVLLYLSALKEERLLGFAFFASFDQLSKSFRTDRMLRSAFEEELLFPYITASHTTTQRYNFILKLLFFVYYLTFCWGWMYQLHHICSSFSLPSFILTIALSILLSVNAVLDLLQLGREEIEEHVRMGLRREVYWQRLGVDKKLIQATLQQQQQLLSTQRGYYKDRERDDFISEGSEQWDEIQDDRDFEKRRHEQLALRLYDLAQRRARVKNQLDQLEMQVKNRQKYDFRQNYHFYHHMLTEPAIILAIAIILVTEIGATSIVSETKTAVEQQLFVFISLVMVFLTIISLISSPVHRFPSMSLISSICNIEIIVTAITIALWLFAECYLLTNAGFAAMGQIAPFLLYSGSSKVKIFQLSLLMTTTVEVISWKYYHSIARRGTRGSMIATGISAVIESVLHHVPMLLLISIAIDSVALFDVFTMRNVRQEEIAAWSSFASAVTVALVRSLALRCIALNKQLTENFHSVLGLASAIAFLLLSIFTSLKYGIAFFTDEGLRQNYIDIHIITAAAYFAVAVQLIVKLVQFSNAGFALQTIGISSGLMLSVVQTPAVIFGRVSAFNILCLVVFFLSWEKWHILSTMHPTSDDGNDSKNNRILPLRTAQHIEDTVRNGAAMMIYWCCIYPGQIVLSLILPEGLKFWTYPGPVADMGREVDYGMAYQVRSKQQPFPNAFVCNVGHIGSSTYDYARTASSTATMLKDFINDLESGDRGFVSDLVAVFPQMRTSNTSSITSESTINGDGVREVNLSAWTSASAAREWFTRSDVHRAIVRDYHHGALDEFSAMLAALHPAEDIKFGIRCKNCSKLNEMIGNQQHQATNHIVCEGCSTPIIHPPFM